MSSPSLSDPDLQKLKRRRGAAKGIVTRQIGLVNDAMSQNLMDEVTVRLQALAEVMDKFCEAHELYHSRLQDEDDIDVSASYLTAVTRDVQDLRHTALTWIEEAKGGPGSMNKETEESAQETIQETDAETCLAAQQMKPSAVGDSTILGQIFTELRGLREVQQQEKQEFTQLIAEQEERLRKELRLQQPQSNELRRADDRAESQQTTGACSMSASSQQRLDASSPPLQMSQQSVVNLLDLARQQHQSHVDSMRLPPADLIKFDGEPLKYWEFVRLFSASVDKATIPDEEKLIRLHQYTTGQAKQAISHCLYLPHPTAGYTEAMATLKRRFGNPYTISQAWVDKVLSCKPIRDNKQLRNFADTLRSCRDTLKAMKCEDELSGGRTLLQIIEKLPVDLKKRWLTVNYEITRSGRPPKLDDVVELIETEAEKRDDPIFGALLDQRAVTNTSSKSTSNPHLRTKQSFAVESKPTTPKLTTLIKTFKCPKCAQGHFLNQCPTFRALSVPGRLAFIQQKKLCQNCFMSGHCSEDCSRAWVCKVPGCGQKHNSWLHSAIVATTTTHNNNQEPMTATTSTPATSGTAATNQPLKVHANATRKGLESSNGSRITLPILPVTVSNPHNNSSVKALALLDSGSNGTFCSEWLVQTLNLGTQKVNVKLSTMEAKDIDINASAVDLCVADTQGKESYLMKGVLCRECLHISRNSLVTVEEVSQWPHLQDVVDEICPADVDLSDGVHLLIGLDQPDVLAPREVRRGRPGEPYATLTGLGWTLNGPVAKGERSLSANFVQAEPTDHLQQTVERFWKLEDPANISRQELSVIDKQVVDLWNQRIFKKDSHYTLPIPLKENPPQLPSNQAMAKRRLDLLGKRLKRDSTLKQQYTKSIHESLRMGYAEEVTNIGRDDGYLWYLPHHPVFHPRKPGKVRVVFDCAARCQGTSLNDCIHQGPDLTNKLLGVLLRFRQDAIALNADIEGMFCQVRVPPQERDLLRFLWWEDDNPDNSPKHYRMTTHLFGGVWSPSAATFALQRVAEDNRSDFSEDVVQTVMKNFYVDDCLKSVPTEEVAVNLATKLQELLARGGFKLTKWLSNSRSVMRSIPAEKRAKSLHDLNLDVDQLPRERTLGVLWDAETDCFTFDVKAGDKPSSRRGILSMTSSVYDPLGFAGPFVLRAKAIFQELCRRQLDWDERIPADLDEQWGRWLKDLPMLSNLVVPRCLRPSLKSTSIELHHFCDASELAYGAVSYARVDNECRIIMSKNRLAPLKVTSIPRLELMAAVVATELDQHIKQQLEFEITETFFWTDSTIVLQYIHNKEQRFQTFVANRVARIHECTETHQWRHVDSASNPADDVSRGLSANELLSSKRWVSGPTFLQQTAEEWPTQPDLSSLPRDAEIKRTKEVYATNCECEAASVLDRLLQQYPNWHRLKRTVVILLRLKALLCRKGSKRLIEPITVNEMKEAETAVLHQVQHTSFGSVELKSSSIASLQPYKDKETKLLRVGGRLANAPISHDAKHQIILPTDHQVTKLIIGQYHLRLGHSGTERVLAEIRQQYWIVKGRSAVKRIVNSCMICRKRKAMPENQQMADLPSSRVSPNEPPFSCVGVDYFGPFKVKRARSEVKRYGCLFTCLATRAIHLEVSDTLDTDSFINALQRFVARRGQPKEIRSDNGTNLVGGLHELRKAVSEWNQQKISNHLLQKNIQWIFNPPGASHMGGVWERQIRTVRSVLSSISTLQLLDDEGLSTLFCTVEAIVNGRPITKLSEDPVDPSPLTPNHLLLLRSGPSLPPGAFVKQDLYRRRWRQVQHLADIFWTRWVKEYLPALQQRQKWLRPKRNLQVGDLVLILHEKTPRNSWPLGLVIDTYPGTDRLVRSVQVKTQAGICDRPVSKLCLLEANLI